MNCQNCGAPLEESSSRGRMVCTYCNTVNQLNLETTARDQIVISGQFSDRSCPCCMQQLTDGWVQDHAVEVCVKCQGFLVNRELFTKIVWQRRSGYGGVEEYNAPPHPLELKIKRNCPQCAGEMETHPYYGPGNTVIDSCAKCELIWLDGGELSAIERAPGQRTLPQLTPRQQEQLRPPFEPVTRLNLAQKDPLARFLLELFS